MPPRITSPAAPVTADQLRQTEERLSITLPDDYRAFLVSYNGGEPTPGWVRYGDEESDAAQITQFHALAEVEAETTELREYRVSNALVPIGTVFDEEVLVLSLSRKRPGAVYWNASNDNFDQANFIRLADSFGELLAKLDYLESTKPWMRCIDDNDLADLTRWLEGGGSANAADDCFTSITAIEHAALVGRCEMVALLLAGGAKPGSAFLYAVQAGHRDIARLLVSRGVKKAHVAEALMFDWVRNDAVLAAELSGKL